MKLQELFEKYTINDYNEIPTWYNVNTGEDIQPKEDHLQALFDEPEKFGIDENTGVDEDGGCSTWFETAYKNGWVRIIFWPNSKHYLGIQTSSKLNARKAANWVLKDSHYDSGQGIVIELLNNNPITKKLNTIEEIEEFIKKGRL